MPGSVAAGLAAAANAAPKPGTKTGKKKDKKDERKQKFTKADLRELLKIKPQKRRAKGVTREQHRKWKDEEKAKQRGIVRATLKKIKKKDD